MEYSPAYHLLAGTTPKYSLGTVLERIENEGVYIHYGIVTGHNKVTHNSKKHGYVLEQSLYEFTGNKRIRVCNQITSKNKLLAVFRAKSRMGERYDLEHFNCEHLVKYAHGINGKTQVQEYQHIARTSLDLATAINDNPRDILVDTALIITARTGLKMLVNNIR